MKKRTKKLYTDLYDNPRAMFPGGTGNDTGVEVILYPNGQPVIWLRSGLHSLSLTASRGPHGLGVHISSQVGSTPLTVRKEGSSSFCHITQYDDTPNAAAYSRWYDHKETEEDIQLLGPDYRRTWS